MTSNHPLGRAELAILIVALGVSACGGSTPTATPAVTPPPTVAAVVTPPPTVAAVVTPPPTPSPTPVPTATPAPTVAPVIDPADDLDIAAPYTLEPLEAALANVFITSMKESMGALGDVFHVGARSAVRDGDTFAWVIVMAFPDMPVDDLALLNGAAAGAAGEGEVEKLKILDRPVRIVETGGLFAVLTMVDNKLVMAMAEGRTRAVNVITAIIEAGQ